MRKILKYVFNNSKMVGKNIVNVSIDKLVKNIIISFIKWTCVKNPQ